jgi:pimeloyl-ACP methyl ester carboxylesterase
MRRAMVMAVALAIACGGCGANSAVNALQGRMLSVSDLPSGWKSAPVPRSTQATAGSCLAGLPGHLRGVPYAARGFVLRLATPTFGEVLSSGARMRHEWKLLASRLARCRSATIPVDGHEVKSTIRPLRFARVGDSSSAYAWSLEVSGVRVGFDMVLFTAGRYVGELVYSSLGPPPVATVRAFARAAVAKIRTGSTAPIADSVSIASAPVKTVQTAIGTVAYRSIGAGPPLVLIMGYGGTMETWDPRFVDALAQSHRVVIFDNAGIGATRALSPLTVDAMANQTAALISALHLTRPDVLGWSMGSMVAQALADLHPTQVDRLVLCASFPGDGTTIRPAQAAIDELNSGKVSQAMSVLFPADQRVAQNGYLGALTSQAPAPAVSKAVQRAQASAVEGWWNGRDRGGLRADAISAPTLIADGTLDRLDPTANSRALARMIPGAKLLLYPDAGHAFLFQDQRALVTQIDAFLSN